MKKFARTITVVRELLKHDVEAALDGDPSVHCHEEIILSFPFIEAIAIQRLAHRLYKEGAPIIPRMMTEWAHSRTGIDIHPGASIGTHFFIDHRDRGGDRGNMHHWQLREALSRGYLGRSQLCQGRIRQADPGSEAPSHRQRIT